MDNLKKQTILCVDDDKLNRNILEAILAPQGYALKFAVSGEDALTQLVSEVPDLILLDVLMPGISGLEVLKKLRSEEKTRSVPVVMLTGLGDEDHRTQGIAAGCDDFIAKPFNEVELIVRVRSLLRISTKRGFSSETERLWQLICEMNKPLIVCSPDWVIKSLNQAAQRQLMSGTWSEKVNFLDYVYEHYSVSVPRNELSDCRTAAKEFQIEKKSSERSGIRHADVNLEMIENAAHEVVSVVVTFKDLED